MGHIALGFSFLEDTARNIIVLLAGARPEVRNIMAAELSFRQKLDALGSLALHALPLAAEASEMQILQEQIEEFISICRRSEALRNTYLHSSYADGGGMRSKISAKGPRGLKIHFEPVDAAPQLDVAEFIAYAGGELENLPILLGIADEVSGGADFVTYAKHGSVVASFSFGRIA